MREVLLLCWRDTQHPQGGGSELYLEKIGSQLAERGVKVTLRTARYRGSARREERDGMTISRAGGRFSVYPRALAAMWLGRLGVGPLRHLAPDAVIDTQNGVPFFARIASKAPVVVLVHHCHREQWPVAGRAVAKIGWFIESRVSPRVHREQQYLTVSLPSRDDLEQLGVDGHRIAVVRNGIDTAPLVTVERSQQPRLVVLSRLVPHKQIEHAIDAVAALGARLPGLHLDIVGDGWWLDELRDYVTQHRATDRVTFHGHVSEQRKHELLARSWVHVLPSRKEGWGLAVIEAAQHGVPTVGYRSSSGLGDSVVDGVTGVLVGSRSELICRLGELLENADERQALGAKAALRAAEFSWERCADGVSEVLEAVADGQRRSGVVADTLAEPTS